MNLRFINADTLLDGILAVSEDLGFSLADGITVTVRAVTEDVSKVSFSVNTAEITYGGGASRFFRALSFLVQWIRDGKTDGFSEEHPVFENNGAMIDMSRNAVMTVDTVKSVLRKMALMGMNTFMLYTEDTYEIENRPYFGYMRGRYTKDELRALDAYAASLGIELIPCVQFLGHLATHLSWGAAAPYRDTAKVLLVGSDATYRLIDDILKTVKACFSSKKIHIGMDETVDLGLGKYVAQNGYRPRHELFLEHLNKVVTMAKSYGFEPMMWSDMFFRLAGEDMAGYYDYHPDVQLPQHICDLVPDGVGQVFWEYAQREKDFYIKNIEKHKKLGNRTLFAGGVWGWSGYAMQYTRSMAACRPALEACKENGIRDVFATAWHNGAESSLITALAGFAWFADFGYTGAWDADSQKATFTRACRDVYDAVMATECIEHPHGGRVGISRALMYNDPLLGLVDKHIKEQGVTGEYFVSLRELPQTTDPLFAPAVTMCKACAALLENKADFGVRLTRAYQENDIKALAALATECDVIIEKVTVFRNAYRACWLAYNKPFGYEVHDVRLGGLSARFETAKARILAYVAGETDRIEELEEERLYIDCHPYGDADDKFCGHFFWMDYEKLATANIL